MDISPMEVTPKLGKGAPDTRRRPFIGRVAGLIKPAQCQDRTQEASLEANQGKQGRIRTSVLNLPYHGKAHGGKPRFQTVPGKSGRTGL